jgi:indole-3-glycerol phosphate synthase
VPTYLDRIGAWHRDAAVLDRRNLAELAAEARAAAPTRGFGEALRFSRSHNSGGPAIAIVAEVKRRSPSKGDIAPQLDPVAVARDYAAGGAACLSVLTDGPHFGGSREDLELARAAVSLPVLRKDFTVAAADVYDARIMGADAVLLIVALLADHELAELFGLAGDLGLDALVEVHDEAELARAAALGATLIGINNRNLRTFETDLAVTERLAPLAPYDTLLVAESGIAVPADAARLAAAGARAMLVGESLMRQADVEAATRALLS